MLRLPRAVREFCRSWRLGLRSHPIAFPGPRAARDGEQRTFGHIGRPWTSVSPRWVFCSVRVCLRRKSRTAAFIALPVIALSGAAEHAYPQDATWSPPTEAGEDFNDPGNWTPSVVPGSVTNEGTASFGTSFQEAPLIGANTTLNEFQFLAGAPEYTIGVGFLGPAGLALNGLGVTNNSLNVQGIEIASGGTLTFNGGATAGDTTHYTNLGGNILFNSSTAGSADFQNESAGTIVFNNSHAGSGEIDNNEGIVNFTSGSNADSVKLFIGATGPSAVNFSGSTAGSAEIEIVTFAGAPAGIRTSTLDFQGGSTAGNATITTNFAVTNFHDTSNAGNADFNLVNESVMNFFDESSADAASIHVDDTGSVNFHAGTTAGTAKLIAGDMGSTDDFTGGFIFFAGNSTADHATITAFGDSNIEFDNASSAGNATLVAGSATRPPGADTNGFIFFTGTSTADHATITVNQFAELSFAPGFFGGGTATAGNANITNNGNTNFFQGSTAGNATINTNDGGLTRFFGESTGGNAQFITNSGGVLDISGLGTFPDSGEPPVSVTGMTAGSIAGAGAYFLGSKQLTVGSNNLSTTVSGIIQDGGEAGGVGGSLVKVGTGTLTLSGANTYTGGTTINGGTLQLGAGGTSGSIIGGVVDNAGATLAFDRSDTMTFAGVISGAGSVAQVGDGTTILTGANTYSGLTTISAGTLAAGGVNVFSDASHTVVESGGTLDLRGFDQTLNNGLANAGVVQLGVPDPTPPGTTLTVAGGYVGNGGALNLNTFLGGDGSPSDRLVISGGAATGTTSVHVTNVGGPGALTTGNGILVVNAINGATTAPDAFALAGEVRAGAFDYDLFRGGVSGSLNDYFLRSDFIVPPIPPEPPIPPIPPFPPTPPPDPLPPSIYPIIGPELATYGVVQPLARQLGLSILGTLDDRVGDTYEPDGCAVAPAPEASSVDLPTRKSGNTLPTRKPGPVLALCPLFAPSVWGRFFGQTVDNHYQAFADPRASGNLGGFQGGIDLLRGSLIAGQYERAGLYGAFGDTSVNVNGLVTNPAATAYINTHTGSVNINAWSGGAYWTHVGPGGWYLDAVLQGTSYGGSASTQFARLDTDGWGFIGSLEGGVPFAFPQLGPGFVLEPQGQILWQKVSFRHDYDGLGDVALGDTTGPSGRLGLRTKWTIVTAGGQVWQPYLRGNLWRDWGAEANTVFSGTDSVPLVNQATMLEFGGGLTGRINPNVSVFANVDYEFAVGSGDNKRNGVRGAFGARYTW
jgi:outer membrane autotransporter protein